MAQSEYNIQHIESLLSDSKAVIIGCTDNVRFTHPAPIGSSDSESITFVSERRNDRQHLIDHSKARVVVCDKSVSIRREWVQSGRAFIVVDRPRLVFSRIVSMIFLPAARREIHRTAVVSPHAKLGKSLHIGPNVVIGAAEIGDNTVIYGNVFIFDNVRIGANVVIKPGAVIGGSGFGLEKTPEGKVEMFPHIGSVIVGDDVEIGANTCIDRGALGDTVIGSGTKLDNLVHIAHNVKIGRRCVVTASATIAGSVILGDDVWVAPAATIQDGWEMGNKSMLGTASYLNRRLPEGETWIGAPAMPLEKFARQRVLLRQLPQRQNKGPGNEA